MHELNAIQPFGSDFLYKVPLVPRIPCLIFSAEEIPVFGLISLDWFQQTGLDSVGF